jgi:uncharacterized iron-regulated protein
MASRTRRALGLVVVLLALVAAAPPTTPWQSPLGRDHPLTGTIWDVSTGATITPEVLVDRLAARRFVLLGEKHDNVDHHRLQAWLVERLIAAGRRPAVAFEMFRADQSEAIARHLAASPRDAAGLGDAVAWHGSGWPPWSLYAPIADAALRVGLPIVAANLSESTTGALRRAGAAGVDTLQAQRLGLDRALPAEARERLVAILRDSHCGHLPERAVGSFVVVQQARDGQMAAALREAGADGGVLIAGAGHARRDFGVPRFFPPGEVTSLAFLEVTAGSTALPAGLPFDYVWYTPRVDDTDPCERFRKPLERTRQP